DLPYVIGQANVNTNPLGSLIQFDPSVFSSPKSITLNSALPVLTNTNGLIDIQGPGAANLTLTRSSAPGSFAFGIIACQVFVQVKIAGLTIMGGLTGLGGGIFNHGTLTITNSTIAGNSAFEGAGIFSDGTLTITNSTIASNSTINGNG